MANAVKNAVVDKVINMEKPASPLTACLADRLVQAGLALLILGSGPLLAVIVLAALGLTRDPNPNPVGFGLLFFFSFWPAVICLGLGILRVRRRAAAAKADKGAP